jgi:ubiquinol-cytochrome c reductase cytochrome b subunit
MNDQFRRIKNWFERWTNIEAFARNFDAAPPPSTLAAWARTTGGIVALLIALQLTTGALLAAYYVPAAAHAYTTVAYIEKMVAAGSWIRALHLYGSQLLPLALALHLAQMFFFGGYYRTHRVAWFAAILLLALTLADGALGYALPFDARAIDGIHVAAGLTNSVPLIGAWMQRWLLVGDDITTLTLSRFFMLHTFILPSLIIFTIVARLFIFRENFAATSQEPERSPKSQVPSLKSSEETRVRSQESAASNPPSAIENRNSTDFGLETSDLGLNFNPQSAIQTPQSKDLGLVFRHSIVVGIFFLLLAVYAAKYPAPLAPAFEVAPADYLPRPGAQFLWLFELLKFFNGAAAAVTATLLVGVIFIGLSALPFLKHDAAQTRLKARTLGAAVFIFGFLVIGGLSAAARLSDYLNPNTRGQLAQQTATEEAFRRAPFRPQTASIASNNSNAANADAGASANADSSPPPAAYTQNCMRCHGKRGEGVPPNPKLIGIAAQPDRTLNDIIGILNDPTAYGLDPKMPSFAKKLTEDEKRNIAEWIESLK